MNPDRPKLEETGERLVPGAHPDHIVEAEHIARYELVGEIAAGRAALDAGCGAGYGAAILARSGARSVAGVDVDPEAVAFAEDRYGDVASFQTGNLLALPYDDDAFDLVVCFEAIEHVVDPERALDELRRVTAAEGVLAISTPNRGVYREDNPFHVKELTTEELREALQARFANVRIFRQQVHMATLLSDDDGQAAADPGTEVPASVRKLAGQEAGQELYAVALAGDGELPEVPNVAVLGGAVAVRQWQDSLAAWEARARHAEAEHDASSIELGHTVRVKDAAVEELEEMRRRVAASGRRGRKLL
jgi:ubiquinone/menaquinone biosynthesis C-methylase UbiE